MGLTPPLPTSFDRPTLEAAGFVGWRKWDELRRSNLHGLPSAPAVCVVFRPTAGAPTFLDTNPGGWFKEQDPTVPIEVLSANWVPSWQVVYIVKADVADRRLTAEGNVLTGTWREETNPDGYYRARPTTGQSSSRSGRLGTG